MDLYFKVTKLRARSSCPSSSVKVLGVSATKGSPSSPELQLTTDNVVHPNHMDPGRHKARRGESRWLSLVNSHEIRA